MTNKHQLGRQAQTSSQIQHRPSAAAGCSGWLMDKTTKAALVQKQMAAEALLANLLGVAGLAMAVVGGMAISW
jgi:hypothetical protein